MTGSSVVEQVIGVAEVQCHVPVIHDVYTALAGSPCDQTRDTRK